MNDAIAIQAAEVLKRQTSMIQRLKTELGTLRGELADGLEGPLSDLLPIIQDEKARLSIRIEAAGLVLQHAGPEPLVKIAVAFLTAVARREDVASSDRVDAIKALAKRAVPKAPAPTASSAGGSQRLGRRFAIAQRRLTLVKAGKRPPDWADDLLDPGYVPELVAVCGPDGIAAAVEAGRLRAPAGAPSSEWPDWQPAPQPTEETADDDSEDHSA